MKILKRRHHRWRSALAAMSFVCSSLLIGNVANAELGGLLYNAPTKLAGDTGNLPDQGVTTKIRSLINSQPQAVWLGAWGNAGATATTTVYNAISRGEIPTFVLYNIPFRDCGQASSGGATKYSDYQLWVSRIADGINGAIVGAQLAGVDHPNVPIVVLLETDSIALIPIGTDPNDKRGSDKCFERDADGNFVLDENSNPKPLFDPAERFRNLSQAITTLASAACLSGEATCDSWQSRVKVYLDGGHSAWGIDCNCNWPSDMASRLVAAGIEKAAGFFTNVSNLRPLGDPDDTEYSNGELPFGKALRAALLRRISIHTHGNGWGVGVPPKNQLIDVSRNGVIVDSSTPQPNGWPAWCDNQTARLGQAPTANPQGLLGVDFVDALLWVKNPGETDGCWGGEDTTPNTQPKLETMKTDSGGTPSSAAGWASMSLACGLITGVYNNPQYGSQSNLLCATALNVPTFLGGWTQAFLLPPTPEGVRIAAYDLNKNTVTLEWQPSEGACGYMVGAAVNNGSFLALRQQPAYIGGDRGQGPPTRLTVSPAVHGSKVQYAVRARKCSDAGTTYSAYGTTPGAVALLFR